jgi:hypothetical protein
MLLDCKDSDEKQGIKDAASNNDVLLFSKDFSTIWLVNFSSRGDDTGPIAVGGLSQPFTVQFRVNGNPDGGSKKNN